MPKVAGRQGHAVIHVAQVFGAQRGHQRLDVIAGDRGDVQVQTLSAPARADHFRQPFRIDAARVGDGADVRAFSSAR